MIPRRALALVLATAALTTSCAGRPRLSGGPPPAAQTTPGHRGTPGTVATPAAATAPAVGLTTSTAFVTVIHRTPVRLRPADAGPALAAVWQVLGAVGALSPQPGGPRLLANLRMNEYLVDVTIWRPQPLDVAGRRLAAVSGIVIPFTGPWRDRVLIVREGTVEASRALDASPDLATLEHLVEAQGNHR